jgi:hypothetical protein
MRSCRARSSVPPAWRRDRSSRIRMVRAASVDVRTCYGAIRSAVSRKRIASRSCPPMRVNALGGVGVVEDLPDAGRDRRRVGAPGDLHDPDRVTVVDLDAHPPDVDVGGAEEHSHRVGLAGAAGRRAASTYQSRLSSSRYRCRLARAATRCNEPSTSGPPGPVHRPLAVPGPRCVPGAVKTASGSGRGVRCLHGVMFLRTGFPCMEPDGASVAPWRVEQERPGMPMVRSRGCRAGRYACGCMPVSIR